MSVLSCRDDLLQSGTGPGNHTLTVTTVNVGLTLLAVWDSDNTGVADFVPLPVAHAIQPQEAHRLVVGDVICFSAQLTSQDGETSLYEDPLTLHLTIQIVTCYLLPFHHHYAVHFTFISSLWLSGIRGILIVQLVIDFSLRIKSIY